MAMNDDPEMWKEQQRFYNFLQHYELHKYHQKFLAAGVSRISHLKPLDDKDLEEVGLSRPERNRLFKKLDENFSLPGLIKVSLSCRHPFVLVAPYYTSYIAPSLGTIPGASSCYWAMHQWHLN